jgi:thiol-disulfide isomerase/thioredoxin
VTLDRKTILAVLALLAGLVVLYVIIDRAVHAPPGSLGHLKREAPRQAPAVTFVDQTGAAHTLAEFKGRYVLLNLWGTWCAPCVRELPALAHLSAAMPKTRFAVIPVALSPGNVTGARAFLDDHDAAQLPAYFDTREMFFRSFRAYALPVTILIDPQGREIARAFGAEEWDAPDAVAYLKSETKIAD